LVVHRSHNRAGVAAKMRSIVIGVFFIGVSVVGAFFIGVSVPAT
jgi:hypothetical protein